MLVSAVIDNTALVNFTILKRFNIFDQMRFIFSKIYIPMEVKKEYEIMHVFDSDRTWILERLRPNEGFYSLCTTYDSINFVILKTHKGIDTGEAEATAQYKRLGANLIVSDDKPFRDALRKIDPTVRIIGTLHVIALLDLHQLLPDRNAMLKHLYKTHKFKPTDLRLAYYDSANQMGLQLSKKLISSKCSLKYLKG